MPAQATQRPRQPSRQPLRKQAGSPVGPAGGVPYQSLNARLNVVVKVSAMAPARHPDAELAAWSMVDGLSCVLIDGARPTLPTLRYGPSSPPC